MTTCSAAGSGRPRMPGCRSGSPCNNWPRTPSAQAVRRFSCARTPPCCAPPPRVGDRAAGRWCAVGQPSAACARLLSKVAGTVRWRGDFDWTGLRTTAAAVAKYAAVPWRMSTADYLAALRGVGDADLGIETEPLKGPPASSPWEPALAVEMAGRGRAVMEERLLGVLLGDLGSGTPGAV